MLFGALSKQLAAVTIHRKVVIVTLHLSLCEDRWLFDFKGAGHGLGTACGSSAPGKRKGVLLFQELGENIDVLCSWSPVEVWFDLPNSSEEFNDTLTLQNYGDEEQRVGLKSRVVLPLSGDALGFGCHRPQQDL